MARRKPQKKTSPQHDPALPAQSCEDAAVTGARATPRSREGSPTPVPTAMVRRSTCIICTVAALLLGIYAGMLAPRFLDAAPPKPLAQTQPVQPRIPDTPPMPPEIAQEITRLEKAVLESPNDAHAWTHLGNLYFDTDQPQQAIEAYERSLALQPGNVDVLTDLGIMYREAGGYAKAVECFRKASSLSPGHENALFNEGVVLYYDLHEKKEALSAWQKLLQINPQARTPDGKSVADMLKTLP